MFNFFSKILDLNAKEIDRLQRSVEQVNAFDAETKK